MSAPLSRSLQSFAFKPIAQLTRLIALLLLLLPAILSHPLASTSPSRLSAGGLINRCLRVRGGGGEVEEEYPSFVKERHEFNHVIRIFNTNIDGTRNVLYALTMIKGIGRRFGDAVIKRAGIAHSRLAGELTAEEVEKIVQVVENPKLYDIPSWMLNRRKDYKTGLDLHNTVNKLDFQLREDLDRLRKMRVHRGLRHAWGWKVRGQHTKTTGRGGRCVGVLKKK